MSIISTTENEGLGKNLAYAIAAQGVGFLSSLVMSLVIPKSNYGKHLSAAADGTVTGGTM